MFLNLHFVLTIEDWCFKLFFTINIVKGVFCFLFNKISDSSKCRAPGIRTFHWKKHPMWWGSQGLAALHWSWEAVLESLRLQNAFNVTTETCFWEGLYLMTLLLPQELELSFSTVTFLKWWHCKTTSGKKCRISSWKLSGHFRTKLVLSILHAVYNHY